MPYFLSKTKIHVHLRPALLNRACVFWSRLAVQDGAAAARRPRARRAARGDARAAAGLAGESTAAGG